MDSPHGLVVWWEHIPPFPVDVDAASGLSIDGDKRPPSCAHDRTPPHRLKASSPSSRSVSA
jgi:hypothetical protein